MIFITPLALAEGFGFSNPMGTCTSHFLVKQGMLAKNAKKMTVPRMLEIVMCPLCRDGREFMFWLAEQSAERPIQEILRTVIKAAKEAMI